MRSEEVLILLVVGLVLLALPLATLILAIVAYIRTRKLDALVQRVAQLEDRLQGTARGEAGPKVAGAQDAEVLDDGMAARREVAGSGVFAGNASREQDEVATEIVTASLVGDAGEPTGGETRPPEVGRREQETFGARNETSPVGWEAFVGQKAFGWLAVVLFVFAAAFFLRYAYQNNWIGPVGRVTIGEFVGVGSAVLGWHYFRRGWTLFSNMLSAAGIIVIYLSTYSAFGFYQLISQQHAGAFLAVLVIESMIAAVIYRSAIVAFVAVIGGLLTPVLMHSERDAYSALFIYLAVLNAGAILALLLRSWWAVGSVAYVGTQLLYAMWYSQNYHPEKFAWALGFQATIFGLHLAHSLVALFVRSRRANSEELARFVVNALAGFASFYVLTYDDYHQWLGTAAVVMATVYALVARAALTWRPGDGRILLTSLSVAVGFLALAIPIQADARWVSLGWAAMGAALWWFGLRVSSGMLRGMAAVLGAIAVGRSLLIDLPMFTRGIFERELFVPIFNADTLPLLGVAACVLISVLVADRFIVRLQQSERFFVGVAGVAGVLLLWLTLTRDVYDYFDVRSNFGQDIALWRWRGQLAISVLWTAYATVLLGLGFWLPRARLRWLAMALYCATVLKLFLVDMANVQQLYRILAFFVLAIVLGLVARTYQRFK